MAGGENLRDGTAGVVAGQVDLAEPEAAAQAGERLGERGRRHVRAGGAGTVRGQVDRDAAAAAAQILDDLPPQCAAGADAVHEQRGRTGAEFGKGDLAGRGGQAPSAARERVDVHESVSYR